MLYRPSKAAIFPVIALVGALLAAFLLLLYLNNQVLAQESDPTIIRYAENSEETVRVFTSTDPEQAGIDWDVTGTDADDFQIELSDDGNGNGVLTFREPPDFEDATDRLYDANGNGDTTDAGDEAVSDNVYHITVRATEQTGAGTGRALSTTTDITVTVSNVEEPGVVDVKWLQPQVAESIPATLTDPDGATTLTGTVGNTTLGWQWYVSKVQVPVASNPAHWVEAGAATSTEESYTPDAADVGKFLRAEATYTDPHSGDPATTTKTAVGVSDYPVETAPADNGSPGFNLNNPATDLPESTPVGNDVRGAVTASDEDHDVLTYELVAAPTPNDGDVEFFAIDKRTGQITVARRLDFDGNPDRDNPNGEYIFVVRATDPSGDFDDQPLTITATEANDKPQIRAYPLDVSVDPVSAKAELMVMEDQRFPVDEDSAATNDSVYTAYDQDRSDNITWSLGGEDADNFELTDQGVTGAGDPRRLQFKEAPDYETPDDANRDSVYKVMVIATDDSRQGRPSLMATRLVTVFVNNMPEKGELTLTGLPAEDQPDAGQPYVDEAITAVLEDLDEGVAIITWQWSMSETDDGTFIAITGATSAAYTPQEGDEGMFLRAVVSYTDTLSQEDDQEGTPQLDERVQKLLDTDVTPKDPTVSGDLLYTEEATTAHAVVMRSEDDGGNGGGPMATGPSFPTASVNRTVAENARVGDYVGAPVVATGADLTYAFASGDIAYFVIDPATGQIKVRAMTPGGPRPTLDYETRNSYTVTVTATNAAGETANIRVDIGLTNVNEAPFFHEGSRGPVPDLLLSREEEHPENSMAAVATYVATDPEGAQIRWSVSGTDAADFTIRGGALRFSTPPDFESPTDRAHDANNNRNIDSDEEADNAIRQNTYQVTVTATEAGTGPNKSTELNVTVTVTNVNEDGAVDINWLQPEDGTALTASVTDPDGPSTGLAINATWTWQRSKVADPDEDAEEEWDDITGANNATYEPTADDVDKYLRAEASYEDGANDVTDEDTRIVVAKSANKVRADVDDDTNNSPDFGFAENGMRTVLENTPLGGPVGAPVDIDEEHDNDILTYELVRSVSPPEGHTGVVIEDLDFFRIDKATGQLRVRRALSHEQTDGRDYTGATPPTAGTYTVVVRATDPSGEANDDNRDDIVVTITATDVNEAPRITAGFFELVIDEENSVTGDFIGLPNPDTQVPGAEDPDYPDGPNNENYRGDPDKNLYQKTNEDADDAPSWRLDGPDASHFKFSTPGDGIGRRIHFVNAPDYEMPLDADRDNVYEVMVVVVDNSPESLEGSRRVRVVVENVDETGSLDVAPEQPSLGAAVTATLTDPDGIMTTPAGDTVTSWQWYWTDSDVPIAIDGVGDITSPTGTDEAGAIEDATTDSYTPGGDDVGRYLHVRVTYRDRQNREDDPITTTDERDVAPADADRSLIAKTDFAVKRAAIGPGGDPGAGNDAPVFNPASITINVDENIPSTGYVGARVVATDESVATLTYDLGGPNANNFALADQNPGYYADFPRSDARTWADRGEASDPPGPRVDAHL